MNRVITPPTPVSPPPPPLPLLFASSPSLDFLHAVTTCSCATAALSLLRERTNHFDLVLSDVQMPDMDGFKLLEHIGLEMDLPVISTDA